VLIVQPVARPSKPSVRFTAFEQPTMISAKNGMTSQPRSTNSGILNSGKQIAPMPMGIVFAEVEARLAGGDARLAGAEARDLRFEKTKEAAISAMTTCQPSLVRLLMPSDFFPSPSCNRRKALTTRRRPWCRRRRRRRD
jgi:hypothetical protein